MGEFCFFCSELFCSISIADAEVLAGADLLLAFKNF
jgi:hypothetical protein